VGGTSTEKMEKMSLSDKITSNWVETDWDSEGNPKVHTNIPSIYIEDVKQAVKELKESPVMTIVQQMEIDRIFGDALI